MKRRIYFVAAVLVLVGLVVDHLTSGPMDSRLVLVQLVWSALFALLGGLVGAGLLPPWVSGVLAGLVCTVVVTTRVHLTGGLASPYFVTIVSVPLLVAMFTPDSRAPILVSILAMVGALLTLYCLAGMAPRTVMPRIITYVSVASMGLYGSKTYRRLRQAEHEAQRSRLRALEQLAESERLRRCAESERAQMERLVLVGQLASGVAHEVNNPLAYVKSNLHYLEHGLLGQEGPPLPPEELRELLQETRQGVLRIEQITTDLRRFSREGAPGEEPESSPLEALEEARRMAAVRLRGLGEVVVDAPPELPPVRLGQRHLLQVLLNLLLNAADAVESAQPARPARILLRAWRQEGHVRLEVEDNGAGLSPEVLPRVFEPFFTTKPPGKGTGLGLALCREYVSRAGGTLIAENRSEGGARFVLTLMASVEVASA